jgi:lipopolysaccharide exporter
MSRILIGGAWLIAGQAVERAIGIVSIAVLARVLTPSDFGIAAVATTIVAMVELITAFGFDWALVRHSAPTAEYLNSAWTLRLSLGFLTLLALTLLGPVAAHFYHLEPLRRVLFVLGLAAFIGSLENIGTVFFRREFMFHKEFILRAIAKASGFVVTLSVALIYRSYWALVAGILAARTGSTVASYILHQYRPRPALTKARDLLSFSSWLLLGNVVDYCREKFSDLYIGRVFGPSTNGLFSVAGELSRIPISEVATPINRVAYSKYSEDVRANRALTRTYVEIASIIWMMSLPMCLGMIAVASEVVSLLLGPRWEGAEVVIRLMALGTIFSVMTANTHYVYWAVGHSRVVAAISAVGAVFVIPATILCSHLWGYPGVAFAYAVTSAALVPVNFLLLRRYAGVGFSDVWVTVWRTVLAATAMSAVLYAVFPHAAHTPAPKAAVMLVLKVVVGAASYAAAAITIWLACGKPSGPESRALGVAQRWIASLAPSA